MANDGDPAPIVRAHRAKRARDDRARSIDWGAVAAGLSVGLVALFGAIAGALSPVVGVSLVAAGLFVGGGIAGRLAAPGARCGVAHGIALAGALTLLMAILAASATLANGAVGRVPLVAIASTGSLSLATALVGALTIGAAGGFLGAAGRGAGRNDRPG